MVGKDIKFNKPTNPKIILENDFKNKTLNTIANKIIKLILKKKQNA